MIKHNVIATNGRMNDLAENFFCEAQQSKTSITIMPKLTNNETY